MDASRSGGSLHGAANSTDRLRPRSDRGAHFRFPRYFDHIIDGQVVQAGYLFADSNRVSPLLDRRIRNEVLQTILRIFEEKSGNTDVAVDVNFSIGTALDGDVTRGISEFEADGAGSV